MRKDRESIFDLKTLLGGSAFTFVVFEAGAFFFDAGLAAFAFGRVCDFFIGFFVRGLVLELVLGLVFFLVDFVLAVDFLGKRLEPLDFAFAADI